MRHSDPGSPQGCEGDTRGSRGCQSCGMMGWVCVLSAVRGAPALVHSKALEKILQGLKLRESGDRDGPCGLG